jgi:hypothetical protein
VWALAGGVVEAWEAQVGAGCSAVSPAVGSGPLAAGSAAEFARLWESERARPSGRARSGSSRREVGSSRRGGRVRGSERGREEQGRRGGTRGGVETGVGAWAGGASALVGA